MNLRAGISSRADEAHERHDDAYDGE